MSVKPRLGVPNGMRDFSPREKLRRDYIFRTLGDIFREHGYAPLETPAMEHLSTLLGKYGEEGDRLLYRVLDSGDYLRDVSADEVLSLSREALAVRMCGKGLRYDLTVPLARYVVEHWHELPRPFKRYQIAPVWRADRPQRGRYREFYQCDIDTVGSDSLLCEVDLIEVAYRAFEALGIRTRMQINNRKILTALAIALGAVEKLTALTVAIDKLEKVGLLVMMDELERAGFTDEQRECLGGLLSEQGSLDERLRSLEKFFERDPVSLELGALGVTELREVVEGAAVLGIGDYVDFDLSLARGLSYYTGAIFEVRAQDVSIGSVCGGGRYDNLTGIFGLGGVSGVGISFGADRIYDCLQELDLFPLSVDESLDVLVTNLGSESRDQLLCLSRDLREAGLRCSYYADGGRLKRQLDYANRMSASWVVLCGADELGRGVLQLKKMSTGVQEEIAFDTSAADRIVSRVRGVEA